ncbi:MAG: hypothetical protein ABIH20_03165 [Candidatus Diapherotrites archaeon]
MGQNQKNLERELDDQLRELLGVLTTEKILSTKIEPHISISSISHDLKSLSEKDRADLFSFCSAMTRFKKDLGNGYRIQYSNFMIVNDKEHFNVPTLQIVDKANNIVGSIEIRIGLPFIISEMHGVKGKGPRDFLKATGKNFDAALIDAFIHFSGEHYSARRLDPPKIHISRGALRLLPHGTRNRIAARYLPAKTHNSLLGRPPNILRTLAKNSWGFEISRKRLSRIRRRA